jgi:hypothetical protein
MESEIIAERPYYLDGQPSLPVIQFQLLRPHLPKNGYPTCHYRLVIAGKETEQNEISSVDTIGCIALCLAVAGSSIAGLNESVYSNKLRWQGWSGGTDIGLPTIEDSPLTKELYMEALRWSSAHQFPSEDAPKG